MDFKVLWAFCVLSAAVCLLPLSNAQCSLDLGGPITVIASVPFSSIFSEYDPSSFTQMGLTYLCYVRSADDHETFSQIRVSVLYRYQNVDGALQLTLDCLALTEINWIYDNSKPSLKELSVAEHVMTNMTREGCEDCRDNSTTTFGDPTYCRLPDPCIGSSVVCANGGSCDRTGLTETACQCAGQWSGMECTECDVTCSEEQTLDEQMCSCGNVTLTPAPGAGAPLSAGAIVGIVVGSFALVALILAIITIVVIILVVDRRGRYTKA